MVPMALVEGSSVRVRVPASSANIGPGFDSIGLALGIWDEYVVTVTAEPGLSIEVEGEGAGELPCDERHLVHRSMLRALQQLDVEPPPGLHLSCRNAVPQGRGLGSSATSIVAGIVAAQGLCAIAARGVGADGSFDHEFTNNLAAAIEGHPDNSSASIFGGMTLSWADDVDPGVINSVQLEVVGDVIPLVFVPGAQLATAVARAALPEQIPLGLASLYSARVVLLVEPVTRTPELLLPATRDCLHPEPLPASFPAAFDFLDHTPAKDRPLPTPVS